MGGLNAGRSSKPTQVDGVSEYARSGEWPNPTPVGDLSRIQQWCASTTGVPSMVNSLGRTSAETEGGGRAIL
jgi:hypothetical protein